MRRMPQCFAQAGTLSLLLLLTGCLAENSTATTGTGGEPSEGCGVIENCERCHNPDKQCAACNTGWVGDATSSCFQCPDHCTECKLESDRATCDVCFQHYFRTDDRLCEQCVGNCDVCSGRDQCTTCMEGHRLLVETTDNPLVCGSCPSNCITCADTTECRVCRDGDAIVSNDVGYYLWENLCYPCPTRCLSCSAVNTCDTCRKGYMFDTVSRICVACIENCEACDSDTTCSKCNEDFSVAPDTRSCLSCAACESCPAEGGCGTTSCAEGYYAHNADLITCKACDDTNCRTCPAAGRCTRCAPGWTLLQVSGDVDKCIACPDLEDSSTCDSCDAYDRDRYFVSATSTCELCPLHCSSCTAENRCDTCATGYYKNTTTVGGSTVDSCLSCSDAMQDCVDCSSASDCTDCGTDHYEVSGSTDSCALCSSVINQCKECSSDSSCTKCMPGYYRDGLNCSACPSSLDNTKSQSICVDECGEGLNPGKYWWQPCVDCPSDCSQCSVSDGVPTCTDCDDGFGLSHGSCVACQSNCLACSVSTDGSTSCTSCEDEYTVSGGSCVSCSDSGCKTCGDQAVCTECKSGYTLVGAACYFDGCAAGAGADTAGSGYSCAACHPSCETCLQSGSATSCTACPYGTHLDDSDSDGLGSCTDCHSSCVSCNGASADRCTRCPPGTFLNDPSSDGYGTCDACTYPCQECNATGLDFCRSCYHQASTDVPTSCRDCASPCKTCMDDDVSTCLDCYDGFYESRGKCLRCDPKCATCSNSSTCDSCARTADSPSDCANNVNCSSETCPADGCYGNVNITCDGECHSDCVTCSNMTATDCTACVDGYYLSAGRCKDCEDPTCKTCDDTASNNCTACQVGFYLDNGACSRCSPPCYECESATNCTRCTVGYFADGSCQACHFSCSECSSNLASACTDCNPGFFLSGSTCEPCDSGCAQCNASATTCTACHSGQILDSTANTCGCDSSCKTCVGNGGSDCLVCADGYTKSGGDTGTAGTCYTNCAAGTYDTGTGCTSCGTGCASCTEGPSGSSQNCGSCTSGRFPTTDGNCDVCPSSSDFDDYSCPRCGTTVPKVWRTSCNNCPTNCVACTRAEDGTTDCTLCVDDFYLAGTSGQRTCTTPTSCDSVETAEECAACSTAERPREWQTRSGVTDCYYKPANCATMVDGLCTECNSGFLLVEYVNGDKECAVCSLSESQCSECNKENRVNYWDTQTTGDIYCLQCPVLCLECGNNGKCTTCVDGYYPSASGDECLACGSTCKRCVNSTVCSECFSPEDDVRYGYHGLVVSRDGAGNVNAAECQACSSNCVACSSGVICTQCTEGRLALSQTLNDAGVVTAAVCQACGSNCNACTSSTFCKSNSCDDYYYRSETDSSTAECARCSDPNCLTCSGPNTCTHCNTGYYVNENACSECMDGCEACTDGSTCLELRCQAGYCYNRDTTSCIQSGNQCQYCTQNGGCLDCGEHLFLELCKDCSDLHCLECEDPSSSTSVDFCTRCSDGYYISNGDCAPCNSNCKCASESEKCTECMPGNFVKVNGACIACSTIHQACVECSDASTCTECGNGYGLADGTCHDCGDFCEDTCDATDKCKSCVSDAYYNTGDNCRACSLALSGCLRCSDDTTCLECRAGYGLSGGTCHSCGTNCLDNCDAETKCKQCVSDAYYKSGDNCQKCGSGCVNCTSDGSSCGACEEGAYLKQEVDGTNTCQGCGTGCEACNSATVCDRCQHPQYTLVDGADTGSRVCAECNIAGCAQCTGSTTNDVKCIACITGYFLDETDQCKRCSEDVSGCVVCYDYNLDHQIAPSECEECSSGQYLPEGQAACIICDISGCSVCEDRAPLCDQCEDQYQATDNKERCLKACYRCLGSDEECDFSQPNSTHYTTEVCRNPATSSCSYQRNTTTVDNVQTVRIAAGCLQNAENCPSKKDCRDIEGLQSCRSCCDGHLCNTELNGAVTMTTSLATSMVTTLLPLILGSLF